jgi:regulator of replication initiation timing
MASKTSPAGLEPLDRLEEKIKLLVNTIVRLKGEHTRAVDENARLRKEIDALKARAGDAERAAAELASLREERDVIRARVSEMLQQLDGLNL